MPHPAPFARTAARRDATPPAALEQTTTPSEDDDAERLFRTPSLKLSSPIRDERENWLGGRALFAPDEPYVPSPRTLTRIRERSSASRNTSAGTRKSDGSNNSNSAVICSSPPRAAVRLSAAQSDAATTPAGSDVTVAQRLSLASTVSAPASARPSVELRPATTSGAASPTRLSLLLTPSTRASVNGSESGRDSGASCGSDAVTHPIAPTDAADAQASVSAPLSTIAMDAHASSAEHVPTAPTSQRASTTLSITPRHTVLLVGAADGDDGRVSAASDTCPQLDDHCPAAAAEPQAADAAAPADDDTVAAARGECDDDAGAEAVNGNGTEAVDPPAQHDELCPVATVSGGNDTSDNGVCHTEHDRAAADDPPAAAAETTAATSAEAVSTTSCDRQQQPPTHNGAPSTGKQATAGGGGCCVVM